PLEGKPGDLQGPRGQEQLPGEADRRHGRGALERSAHAGVDHGAELAAEEGDRAGPQRHARRRAEGGDEGRGLRGDAAAERALRGSTVDLPLTIGRKGAETQRGISALWLGDSASNTSADSPSDSTLRGAFERA